MSTKFFNNQQDNTLLNKFKGIVEGMQGNFHSFLAITAYFHWSGYFTVRNILYGNQEKRGVQEIKILVGTKIIENWSGKTHKPSVKDYKESFEEDFLQNVKEALYTSEVEDGVLQLYSDMKSRKFKIRIHKSRKLHAKFYLFLPKIFNEHSDGWVIMGSSNFSDSGLGENIPPNYELNIALKEYDDVSYCKTEFEQLWEDSCEIKAEDIENILSKTHLYHLLKPEKLPTPYEIFMKILIDHFGAQIEDDYTAKLPEGYKELEYQKDAAIQGYAMLQKHNGFFLADVVGTGKTIIAAMIAQRFIEKSGESVGILVVHPPAVKDNWEETFKDFGLKTDFFQSKAKVIHFVSSGSLYKVSEGGDDGYFSADKYDLVIVDEAHNFCNDDSKRYDYLQRICKSGNEKKVILLSATPHRNSPSDFQNLLLLFQNEKSSTIDNVGNIREKFYPWNEKYKKLMEERKDKDSKGINTELSKIYEEIREEILNPILIRRTRKNLENNHKYKQDLEKQNIRFPKVLPPKNPSYELDSRLRKILEYTIEMLTDVPDDEKNPKGKGLHFARYRVISYIIGERKKEFRNDVKQSANAFSGIFRVHMIKRLESSFEAFKKSLDRLYKATVAMIDFWNENKIPIPKSGDKIDIIRMMDKGQDIDSIIEYFMNNDKLEDRVYEQGDFDLRFWEALCEDKKKLEKLKTMWSRVEVDPKFDLFKKLLDTELMQNKIKKDGQEIEFNKEQKLIIFSESVDTVKYLEGKLKDELKRADVLAVYSENRKAKEKEVKANFDANLMKDEQENKYNIIISSDVLSEGVNLHRANVIVNYDSPWNATRLMQRIGRVNRIGTSAENIHNYVFYPSKEGEAQIQLYTNALIKLQSFHHALGEDSQIYSQDEVLREFELYDANVEDNVDKELIFKQKARDLYEKDKELYEKIKALPNKTRTVRLAENRPLKLDKQSSIVHIKTGNNSFFYKISGTDNKAEKLSFLEAVKFLEAEKEERAGNFQSVKELHYQHIKEVEKEAKKEDQKESQNRKEAEAKIEEKEKRIAKKFREVLSIFKDDKGMSKKIAILQKVYEDGRYSLLPDLHKEMPNKIVDSKNKETIGSIFDKLYEEYHKYAKTDEAKTDESESKFSLKGFQIISSVTFE